MPISFNFNKSIKISESFSVLYPNHLSHHFIATVNKYTNLQEENKNNKQKSAMEYLTISNRNIEI